MKEIKNNNGFLITCISCIVLAVFLCYFGVNNLIKDTYAAYPAVCDSQPWLVVCGGDGIDPSATVPPATTIPPSNNYPAVCGSKPWLVVCGGDGVDPSATVPPATTPPSGTTPGGTTPGGTTPSRTTPSRTTPSETTPSRTTPSGTTPSGGNNNVNNNPQTGAVAIFVIWVIGFATIIYSVWYFRKIKEN